MASGGSFYSVHGFRTHCGAVRHRGGAHVGQHHHVGQFVQTRVYLMRVFKHIKPPLAISAVRRLRVKTLAVMELLSKGGGAGDLYRARRRLAI